MNCTICKTNTTPITEEKSGLIYHHCPECTFVFLDSQFVLSPKEEKSRYEMHENTIDNEGYVRMFEDFIKSAIASATHPIHSILEYGCGPGPVLAELLRRRGFTVDIYDPYFSPIKVYTDKKYDMITTTEVIEHVKDPIQFLRLLKSLLNKNGSIAIMTQFNQSTPDTFLQWYYRREDTHISFFTHKTFFILAQMLEMQLEICDNKKICVLRLL